ncbi:MAG: 4Fe-4S binding protein [Candidatus Promineifilaceae bacterium]
MIRIKVNTAVPRYITLMRTEWLPKIDSLHCTGCGSCVAACPEKALALLGQKASLVNVAACTYCRTCEAICPTAAIDLPFLICFAPNQDLP